MSAPMPADAVDLPVADLERRLTAYALDRALGWGIAAAVAYAVRTLADTSVLVTALVFVGTVVVLGCVTAVLMGTTGVTPAKAMLGQRVVRASDGRPIGVGPALGRVLVLGVAGLPTLGLGAATLGWTAAMDPRQRRRGLHDRIGDAVVVDVRPRPVADQPAEERPQQLVNLTAMRLLPNPVPQEPAAAAPAATPGPVSLPAGVTIPPPAPAAPVPAAPAGSASAPAGSASAPPAPTPAGPASSPAPEPTPAGPVPASPASAPPAARATAPAPAAAPGPAAALAPAAPSAGPAPAATGGNHRADGPAVAPRPTHVPGSDGGTARWHVAFDTGEAFEVAGLALVGRRPEPRPGEPVRHVVPLLSGDMSLSKTHAQFQVAPDGALVVMDRGSTNGSYVVRRGHSRQLAPGRPSTLLDGDVVRFGDRSMKVTRLA